MSLRFLFTALPTNDLGLLTRSLPIAWELAERGHHIDFSNPAMAPRRVIEDAGFENILPKHPLYELGFSKFGYHALTRLMRSGIMKKDYGNIFRFMFDFVMALPIRFAPSSDEVWDMDHAAAIEGMMNVNFIRAQTDAYIKVVEESEADIVVDFWNPFAIIAARVLKKPLVTINQADAHPKGKGFIWWKKKPEGIPSTVPAMNKVLRSYGLDPIKRLEELNLGDLTLISGIPETDPLDDDTGCSYIGPAIWQKEHPDLPEWFEKLPDDKPVVWLYPGNPTYGFKAHMFDSKVILQAATDVLGNEDMQVVLAMGYHDVPKELLPLPSNFIHVRYVPGIAMAQRCDLMVHHGGYGSCQTALYTGTPAVIIPTFSERESNARRISAIGAAEYVPVTRDKQGYKKVDHALMKEKVRMVLSDGSYKKKAEQYSKKLEKYGGPGKAADIIEAFVGRLNALNE
jgi:MGT family glycosyltransferase